MLRSGIIGVVGFGKDPLTVGALQWTYDYENHCLSLILLGNDRQIPIDIISLSNVVPKEFVKEYLTDKRRTKVKETKIVENIHEERNDLLRELAQYVSDSKRESWNKEDLIKFYQAMEM